MSFYGKVYQSLVNGWKGFKFVNKGKATEDLHELTQNEDEIMFDAQTTHDIGQMRTGNQWIQFAKDPNANVVNFYHGPAQSKTPQVIHTLKAASRELEAQDRATLIRAGKQIKFGDGIVFNQINYDKAGHIINDTEEVFVMPDAPPVVEISQDIEELQSVVGVPLSDEAEPNPRTVLVRLERLDELALELKKACYLLDNTWKYKEKSYPELDPFDEAIEDWDNPDTWNQHISGATPALKPEVRSLRSELGPAAANTNSLNGLGLYKFLFGNFNSSGIGGHNLSMIYGTLEPNGQGGPSGLSQTQFSLISLIGNIGLLKGIDEINPFTELNTPNAKDGVISLAIKKLFEHYKTRMDDLTSQFNNVNTNTQNAINQVEALSSAIGSPGGGVLGGEETGIFKRMTDVEATNKTQDQRLTTLETFKDTTYANEKSALDTKVSGIDTRVSTLENSTVPGISTRVTTLETFTDVTYEADKTGLDSRITELETFKSNTYESDKETLEGRITPLETFVNTTYPTDKGKVTILEETTIPALDTRVETLETDYAALGDTYATISSVEELSGTVDGFQETIDTLSQTVNTLQEKVTGEEGGLKSLLTQLQEQLSELSTQVSGFEDRIATLEAYHEG